MLANATMAFAIATRIGLSSGAVLVQRRCVATFEMGDLATATVLCGMNGVTTRATASMTAAQWIRAKSSRASCVSRADASESGFAKSVTIV
jgi:hypothetical protein